MTAVQLPAIRRKVLGDQLVARLVALPGSPSIVVYRGSVTRAGRRPQVDGSIDPPLIPDVADVVAPYVVVFDGTGTTDLEPDLADANEDLRWTPQTTVAAGFDEDCIQAVDRVFAWLNRWSPSIPGVSAGRLRVVPGFDAGPPRPDTTVKPARFFVPLQWQLDLTT